MPYNINTQEVIAFDRYFLRIDANTSEFQKAILPLLNSDWDKNSELLIAKLQSFADQLESSIYHECIEATKKYINGRDFIAPNKYETTSYFYGALQYNSESKALKNLNQKLNQLIENIPEQNTTWKESFENLWLRTASTLFSAFGFAKENPLSTIAALLYGQVALASAFPAVFELSTLDGSNGFKINGENAGDLSSHSVSSAGDVNGDGIDDLIIGAYGADPRGDSYAGSSYVVFGKTEPWATPLELSSLDGTNGFKINGEKATDFSGISVSTAGDFNVDGIGDLLIGASAADPDGRSSAGSSYVVFGKTGTWTTPLELSTLNGANGFKINGELNTDYSGRAVSFAGDINSDGASDLVVGAWAADPNGKNRAGSSYVIFGENENWAASFECSALNGTNGFKINGEVAEDYSGYLLSFAGDINGDTIDDLIISAYRASPGGKTYAGSSYVIFGQDEPWTAVLELSTLDGNNGFKINGEAANDRSGYSVSNAGDINGDGIGDLLVGAYRASPNGILAAGSSYVIFGKKESWTTPFELSTLNGVNGFKMNGEGVSDWSGYSLSSVGDINGDGYGDLIIGAYGAGSAGVSYVVFGKDGPWTTPLELSTLNGTNGFKINGEVAGDYSGRTVSAAGDINDDGIADLIVGAYQASPNGKLEAGSTYVIFGVNLPPVLTGNSSSVDYIANGSAKIIDDSIIVTDVDNWDLMRGVVSIANNFQLQEDELHFTDQNGITGFYNSTTGILTLSGFSTLANYQAALRNITYYNLSADPVMTPRNISFIVNDRWHDSNPIFRTINIIPVGDVSVLVNSGGSFNYTENDPATIIDSSIIITDVHHVNLTNATVAITSNFHYLEDVLMFINQNNIAGFYNNVTGVLVLTGSSSIANYQSALGSVTYENLVDNPVTDGRTVTFMVNNGVDNSNTVTRDINIISVNDIPVLTPSGFSLNYTENDPPTEIDPNITIFDADHVNLTGGTVAIISNFNFTQDRLIFNNQSGIVGFYDAEIGVLTLTGTSNIANYQIALRTVSYENLSNNPVANPRTIFFAVTDGKASSIAVTRDINIILVNDAPQLLHNELFINQGQKVYITQNYLSAIDEETPVVDLVFSISNLQHGYFEDVYAQGISLLSFQQRKIIDSEIRFVHDGSTQAPTYNVTVSDGLATTLSSAVMVNFKLGPRTGDENGFDWWYILIAIGLAGLLSVALRIYFYKKATQSFEKLTNVGDVSTTEQAQKVQADILRPIAQAIFDRIKITGCFGYISDNQMKDYFAAVTKLIVELQQQAVNVDLDNLSPASQSLLINEVAKQAENLLLPKQSCCTYSTFSRYLGQLCSAQISPEDIVLRSAAIALLVKNSFGCHHYGEFISEQSTDAGHNGGKFKNYEAPIEMAVLGSGLFAKSGDASLPMSDIRVAVERSVVSNVDAKQTSVEDLQLRNLNSNQAEDKVCAIDLVQFGMGKFGNSADSAYRADLSQPKSPAFFQSYDESKSQVMPGSKGTDEKQNVLRV